MPEKKQQCHTDSDTSKTWEEKKMKETFSDRQTQQQKNNDHSTDSD